MGSSGGRLRAGRPAMPGRATTGNETFGAYYNTWVGSASVRVVARFFGAKR